MTDPRLSQHPVDVLIRHIIAGERRATDDDIGRIIERVATAPFDPRTILLPVPLRGRRFLGQILQTREPSLVVHLAQRVLGENQWSSQTRTDHYLDDLRRAVRAFERLAVYDRRSGGIVASIGTTVDVVPEIRQSNGSRALLVVIYSVDRRALLTGYQASGLDTVSIPENALWLR
jgi:hypothetical protein